METRHFFVYNVIGIRMSENSDIIEFQIRRNINRLCRNLLVVIEDLKFQQQEMLRRILPDLEPDIRTKITLTHILSDPQMAHIRKRILDNGNDIARDLILEIDNFEILRKHKK